VNYKLGNFEYLVTWLVVAGEDLTDPSCAEKSKDSFYSNTLIIRFLQDVEERLVAAELRSGLQVSTSEWQRSVSIKV